MLLTEEASRFLFFTGKGGVGKTSVSSATALALAEQGRRVLLVSTDPASNLDEVLGVALGNAPRPVPEAPGLFAMNVNPEEAARAYRERAVGPYRGVLPAAALRSIEEQVSGACTVEIAAFDEFAALLGQPSATEGYDHVVFDTAPTGHTLRLLELPTAWSGFLDSNVGGTSCLGPLAGLEAQRSLYAAARAALADAARTVLVLVTRPEPAALREAERTRRELAELGINRQRLVVNGVFTASERGDPVALQIEQRGSAALERMPAGLAALPRSEVPLLPFGLVGLGTLRALSGRAGEAPALPAFAAPELPPLDSLLDALEASGRGVIFTMGKGGVGKTSVAVSLAVAVARRGHAVHLSTTDPAAHVAEALGAAVEGITVSRIDPERETRAYSEEVLATAGAGLDEAARALLEEDLRSPCTEEIAVFRAFARTVAQAETGFVVLDTAPSGHTLLLLDAAESYHREVLKKAGEAPPEVRALLPRLRDPTFAKVLLVTLPEATPVHEARALQRDLERAGIRPFAWVVNQSLTPLTVRDPVLISRRAHEAPWLAEVAGLGLPAVLVPWLPQREGQRLDLLQAEESSPKESG